MTHQNLHGWMDQEGPCGRSCYVNTGRTSAMWAVLHHHFSCLSFISAFLPFYQEDTQWRAALGHYSKHSLPARSAGLQTRTQNHTHHLSRVLPSLKPPSIRGKKHLSVRTSLHLQHTPDKYKSKNVWKVQSPISCLRQRVYFRPQYFYSHEFEAEYHQNMRCETAAPVLLSFKQYSAQITARLFHIKNNARCPTESYFPQASRFGPKHWKRFVTVL